MTFVRSFDNFYPPVRHDGVPFTAALIQEASSASGPWTTIETVSIGTPDADPSQPAARDFTTSLATLDPVGWYRIVWRDSIGATFSGDPVLFDQTALLATIEDVERVLQITIPASRRADVQAALRTAQAWALDHIGDVDYLESGEVQVTHYDVPEDGSVPALGAVTGVSYVTSAGGDPVDLPETGWTFDGERVRLRPDLSFNPFGLVASSDSALATRLPGIYTSVTVTSTRDGAVDPRVRDAVAHAAAALWTRGPRLAKGLSGEGIGDYSYTVAQLLNGDPFFEQAKVLLRGLLNISPLVP